MAEVSEFQQNPESDFFENLAKNLSKEDLQRIGNEVVDGYIKDKESLTELEEIRVQYNKLFNLKWEKKTFPWANASNVKLPALTTACINFQARASINLLPPKNIVKVFPFDTELESELKAARVQKYMNWQLMFDMPTFRSSWDKTLMMLPKDGHAFRKVFWDATQQKVISDYILPQDFIVNYYTKDLETSQRYTQVLHLTANEIKIKEEQGIYINTDGLDIPLRPDTDNLTENNKQNVGESEPQLDYATPREVLEIHTIINLKENDKIRKPFIVTVDKDTRQVTRIINRKNPLTDETMNYVTSYEFIPNPDSIYGYGFGLLLLGANKAMNTAVNQTIDAAHLSSHRGGWILKGSQASRGNLSFEMGEFKEVNARTDDIRKAIFPLDFTPPSPVLMNLITFLQNYVNNLTTVTELFTGSAPKSDTTATSSQLAAELGSKVFTGIQQRIHSSFQKELKKIFDLNAIFIDEEEYAQIVSTEIEQAIQATDQTPPELQVSGQDDFLSSLDIRPVSDPNIISDAQNIGKAEVLAQVIAQNPFLAEDPAALKIVMERRLLALNENTTIVAQLSQIMDQAIQNAQNQSLIAAEQAKKIQEQQVRDQEGQQLLQEQEEIENLMQEEEEEQPQ